jgi:hypothetical protein
MTDEFEELPERETTWQATDRVTNYRKRLLAAGYQPVLLNGKKPLVDGWQNITATDAIISGWAQDYPDKWNTGILTRTTPALDIDVTDEEAAEELEALAEDMIGKSAVRIGQAPKRAIVFRTDTPFDKLTAKFVAPNGAAHRIEIMGDGQQIVVDGIHPDTGQPYHWHGGEPGPELKRDDLLLLTAEKAAEYVAAATKLLTARGWKLDDGRKKKSKGKGNGGAGTSNEKPGVRERGWATAALDSLVDELAATKEPGRNDKLYKCAFRMGTMIARGWIGRDEVETALYGAALACGLVNDDGEKQTRDSIESGLNGGADAPHPDLIDDVPAPAQPATGPEEPPPPKQSVAEAHTVFKKWLGAEYDLETLDIMLAVAVSEKLPGDPAWLLIISGPGNAKTELVQSTSGLGARVISEITSVGALLSASPRRQRAKNATGGLLKQIGERGILAIKDFTSILSTNREVRGLILAALREIHDGHWVRDVGSDGGQTLEWKGRLVVIGACTTAWDQAHSVIATMGDRFVLVRSSSHIGRITAGQYAMRNTGNEKTMRKELADAVAGVVAGVDAGNIYKLSDEEAYTILSAADLVTLARTGVEMDYRGHVIDAHDPEMPTRFVKQLTQIMRGAVAIGLDRADALALTVRCARDSMPQLRLAVMRDIAAHPGSRVTDVRRRLQKPWATVDRVLQALHTLGLVICGEGAEPDEAGDSRGWRYSLAMKVRLAVLNDPRCP